ncbi:H-NS family nucleoid-associated regulatory protein [Variibacter gotjawalensis]
MRKQLSQIEHVLGWELLGSRKRGVRKGTRLRVKYRGPNGEEWSGRGLRPIWLRDQIKRGRREEQFLIVRPGSY